MQYFLELLSSALPQKAHGTNQRPLSRVRDRVRDSISCDLTLVPGRNSYDEES